MVRDDKKIKIMMYSKHFAYVDRNMMRDFTSTSGVVNFTAWIREQAFNDFGIRVKGSLELEEFESILKENYYEDKTEWLKEKMRNGIRMYKNKILV